MAPCVVSEGVKAWATTTGGHGLSSPQSENNVLEGGTPASVLLFTVDTP
jgi:hypothetical protein